MANCPTYDPNRSVRAQREAIKKSFGFGTCKIVPNKGVPHGKEHAYLKREKRGDGFVWNLVKFLFTDD